MGLRAAHAATDLHKESKNPGRRDALSVETAPSSPDVDFQKRRAGS